MKKKMLYYSLLLAFLLAAAAGIYMSGKKVRLPYADIMEKAAERHAAAAALIKQERLSRGYPLAEEDRLGIGLLGLQTSPITTSLGALDAKKTAQLPDFAALCVRLFEEAGVKKGDRVGACFSASFPGLDLAVLCAAEELGLRMVYHVSLGSSNYGANLPGYTIVEMIETAVSAGLISAMPQSVSMGGESDKGRNMQGYALEETEEIEAMIRRLSEKGILLSEFDDYEENALAQLEKMGDIKAFVNVGGNILGLGNVDKSLSFGQGLLKPADPPITPASGLVERCLSRGIPTIHLLNIKQLCAENGIAFDPAFLPEAGSEAVYFSRGYSRPAIAACGILALAGIAVISRTGRKRRESAAA